MHCSLCCSGGVGGGGGGGDDSGDWTQYCNVHCVMVVVVVSCAVLVVVVLECTWYSGCSYMYGVHGGDCRLWR